MKREIVFAREGKADLIGVYDYIAERDGESRAEGYLRRIEKACTSLETMPRRGTDRSDLRPDFGCWASSAAS